MKRILNEKLYDTEVSKQILSHIVDDWLEEVYLTENNRFFIKKYSLITGDLDLYPMELQEFLCYCIKYKEDFIDLLKLFNFEFIVCVEYITRKFEITVTNYIFHEKNLEFTDKFYFLLYKYNECFIKIDLWREKISKEKSKRKREFEAKSIGQFEVLSSFEKFRIEPNLIKKHINLERA